MIQPATLPLLSGLIAGSEMPASNAGEGMEMADFKALLAVQTSGMAMALPITENAPAIPATEAELPSGNPAGMPLPSTGNILPLELPQAEAVVAEQAKTLPHALVIRAAMQPVSQRVSQKTPDTSQTAPAQKEGIARDDASSENDATPIEKVVSESTQDAPVLPASGLVIPSIRIEAPTSITTTTAQPQTVAPSGEDVPEGEKPAKNPVALTRLLPLIERQPDLPALRNAASAPAAALQMSQQAGTTPNEALRPLAEVETQADAPAAADKPATVLSVKVETAGTEFAAGDRKTGSGDLAKQQPRTLSQALPTYSASENVSAAAAPVSPSIQTSASEQVPATAAALLRPHDFTALVDRLVAAREQSQPQAISLTLDNADFGAVKLHFRQEDAGLSVTLANADPEFARAANAAMPALQAVAQPAAATTAGGDTPTREHTSAGSGADTNSQPRGNQSDRREGSQSARANPSQSQRQTGPDGRRRGIYA